MTNRMSAFSPDNWPFSITELPKGACLVGGSVRDQLLRRQAAYLDLDFVLPQNAIETAREIANAYDAGFVVLDEARCIARVVFEQVTVDFAQQQGDSVEADLYRRDFTINAIAYNPHSKTLIDPLGGQVDIQHKVLRMVNHQNLASDPLRLLRAYRQAAQLGFTVEQGTERAIASLADKLSSVSIERVRSELDGLLATPNSATQLAAILQHQLLAFCLPHFDISSVHNVQAVDKAIETLATAMPDYAHQLKQWTKPVSAGDHRSWIKAVKLSCLLSQNSEIADAELTYLKYSRNEIQVILTLIETLPTIDTLKKGPLSRSQQFFLFKKSGAVFPAVSLLALAKGVSLSSLHPLIARFLDAEDALAHAPSLISGKTLIQKLAIQPGPEIGQILAAVEQAQAEGVVSSEKGAIAWVKNWLQSNQISKA